MNTRTALAKRVQSIQPSPTLAISALARELQAKGEPVINLSLGEPDFDTPAPIREAAIQAIHQGFTRYTASDGMPSLKRAIINKFSKENGLYYDLKQILVSNGAKHSIYNCFQALLDPDDEVIIPAPYWTSYPDMALLSEAKPVIIPATLQARYKITPEQLAAAITAKTRALVINSPSNPTGMAYTRAELKALAQVLLKHPQIMILSDDIYEHILWSNEPFANIVMACPELYERTVVINGASKTYAMTGWRIGYAAGPLALISAMADIQSQSTSNPCSIAQVAAEAALNGDQSCVREMTAIYKRRHDQLLEWFNTVPGFQVLPADGAFYAFINVEEAMADLNFSNDLEFSQFLLNQAKVAIVPGSAFGLDQHIRISYAADIKLIFEAFDRIQTSLAKVKT